MLGLNEAPLWNDPKSANLVSIHDTDKLTMILKGTIDLRHASHGGA